MSRVEPAPLPRTPKKTISTITKQIALTSSGSRQLGDHVVIGISTNPMPI